MKRPVYYTLVFLVYESAVFIPSYTCISLLGIKLCLNLFCTYGITLQPTQLFSRLACLLYQGI